MSDSLKDRLAQHSHAFESLLSLIPARYYYDEETSNQWKKKGMRKSEEAKEEAKRNKQGKFDPSKGSTALDELKRREQLANEDALMEPIADDEKVTIFDDNGNPVGSDEEISVQELLKLKSIEKLKPGEFKLESTPVNESNSGQTNQPKVEKSSTASKSGKKENSISSPEFLAKDSFEDSTLDSDATETVTQTKSDQPQKSSQQVSQKPKTDLSKPGIEALRAKLAAKVEELRTKRKAPGTTPNAPKNRAELLAARKLKLEQKKKLNKASKEESKEDETNNASESEDEEPEQESDLIPLDMNLSFGQVKFKDGDKLSKDGSNIEQQRKLKKRNAIDQLKVVENKKAKISKLDADAQNEIAEKAKWSRAILQSEGAKIRDDEKLLKRTIKKKENRKKKSEKEWNRRIYQTKKGISDREAKRDANIAAHREAKRLKLKGRKRREHMKKAAGNFKAH